MLREFSEKQNIPYPLLSDLDSSVIREYGIINSLLDSSDAMLYGIPFPGAFVTDEDGIEIVRAVRRGNAFLDIARYAQDNDISVIIVGTHGRTGLA